MPTLENQTCTCLLAGESRMTPCPISSWEVARFSMTSYARRLASLG